MEPVLPPAHGSFNGLSISPEILAALDALKFVTPTPIQASCIPAGVEGKDIIGIAQTGTGKTLAFGIPMMQRVLQGVGHGLVILPTRELALQVDETIQRLGKGLGIRTAVLIGGASMQMQRQMIRNKPQIVIATPGRLIDHLEQRTITLNTVRILVLDEADRMLDMGFAPQINRILEMVPKDRQTMLFSATMPHTIVSIATKHMKMPLRIEVAPQGTTAERIQQEVFIIPKADKLRLLEHLLTEYKGSILVFSRTKFGAKKIARAVNAIGHPAAEIHSNRSLAQRREALDGFKSGRYRVLIATDIAARGIDVTGIELVINFDMPDDSEDYVHRIGRTARAGREGKAISFVQPDQSGSLRNIERLIRAPIPRKSLPSALPPPRVQPPIPRDEEPRRYDNSARKPHRDFGRKGSTRRQPGNGRRR
jgi:ATP-dependent RNA helicase RhlE